MSDLFLPWLCGQVHFISQFFPLSTPSLLVIITTSHNFPGYFLKFESREIVNKARNIIIGLEEVRILYMCGILDLLVNPKSNLIIKNLPEINFVQSKLDKSVFYSLGISEQLKMSQMLSPASESVLKLFCEFT